MSRRILQTAPILVVLGTGCEDKKDEPVAKANVAEKKDADKDADKGEKESARKGEKKAAGKGEKKAAEAGEKTAPAGQPAAPQGDTPAVADAGVGAALKLAPDSATVLFALNVQGLLASTLYTSYKTEIEAGAKDALELATKCDVGPENWKSVVMAFSPERGPGSGVLIVTAAGLGKQETVACIAKEAGEEVATVADGGKIINLKQDGSVGYVINDDSIAMAGKDWAEAVKGLRDGHGKRAVEGDLKELIARTDTGKHVWFAGKLPALLAAQATIASPGFTPTDVSGWLDLSSGVSIQVAVGTADASKIAGELKTQFDAMKGMANGLVPQAVVDSVKIGNANGAVTATANASTEDLKVLTKNLKGMLEG